MNETRIYDLPPFSGMDISTGVHAIITEGPTQSVRAEASHMRLLDRLKLQVVDGQLRARHASNLIEALLSGSLFNFSKLRRAATVHITVPALANIHAATGAQVEVGTVSGTDIEIGVSTAAEIAIAGARLETISVNASSGGVLSLAGACETLTVKASSAARIDAVELSSTACHVEASSGSAIEASVTTRAGGQISSSATVSLFGRPQVMEIKTSSAGVLSIN